MERSLREFQLDLKFKSAAIREAAVRRLFQQAQTERHKPESSVLDVLPIDSLLISEHTVRPLEKHRTDVQMAEGHWQCRGLPPQQALLTVVL